MQELLILLDKMKQLWHQDSVHSQQSVNWQEEGQAVTPSLLILGPPGRGEAICTKHTYNMQGARSSSTA